MKRHIRTRVEVQLEKEAKRISEQYGNAPVVIVVGGVTGSRSLTRTMTASAHIGSNGGPGRLRDLLGLLQTSIQIESWKHMEDWSKSSTR
jgi:hypothetical protein